MPPQLADSDDDPVNPDDQVSPRLQRWWINSAHHMLRAGAAPDARAAPDGSDTARGHRTPRSSYTRFLRQLLLMQDLVSGALVSG